VAEVVADDGVVVAAAMAVLCVESSRTAAVVAVVATFLRSRAAWTEEPVPSAAVAGVEVDVGE